MNFEDSHILHALLCHFFWFYIMFMWFVCVVLLWVIYSYWLLFLQFLIAITKYHREYVFWLIASEVLFIVTCLHCFWACGLSNREHVVEQTFFEMLWKQDQMKGLRPQYNLQGQLPCFFQVGPICESFYHLWVAPSGDDKGFKHEPLRNTPD